tara:strand:- start:83 stop:676 length:594 start_codon:yes stop_codon:yes gene_type:complete
MIWFYDNLRLKLNNYIIIDNFFPDDICTQLRERCLNAKRYNDEYWDYKAVDFDYDPDNDSLKDISDKYVSPKFSLAKNYLRAWTFVYDNVALGVLAHADPSFININVWVTPDECVHDHNKNGLIIYRRKAKSNWTHHQYNGDLEFIKSYLKGAKYDRIPYKYNRAIIFRGNTFHKTDNVHMKQGHENKRINYTFLYK